MKKKIVNKSKEKRDLEKLLTKTRETQRKNNKLTVKKK